MDAEGPFAAERMRHRLRDGAEAQFGARRPSVIPC
jgi:hypothetical protein